MDENQKPEFKLLQFAREDGTATYLPTKYDLRTPDGKNLRMSIEPCGCGLRAVYYHEIDLADSIEGIPDFLKDSVKEQFKGKKRRVEVLEEHLGKIRFRDRLLDIFFRQKGYERKINKFHLHLKNSLEDYAKQKVVAAGIMSKIRG